METAQRPDLQSKVVRELSIADTPSPYMNSKLAIDRVMTKRLVGAGPLKN